MKPLTQLTNTDKAELLHQLFPDEIPQLLQFVQGLCEAIQENEETYLQKWDNGLFGFGFWLNQLREVESKIKKYDKRLHSDSQLFAEQLFDGFLDMYMVHCLTIYTTTRQHPNQKFIIAINLLFNP